MLVWRENRWRWVEGRCYFCRMEVWQFWMGVNQHSTDELSVFNEVELELLDWLEVWSELRSDWESSTSPLLHWTLVPLASSRHLLMNGNTLWYTMAAFRLVPYIKWKHLKKLANGTEAEDKSEVVTQSLSIPCPLQPSPASKSLMPVAFIHSSSISIPSLHLFCFLCTSYHHSKWLKMINPAQVLLPLSTEISTTNLLSKFPHPHHARLSPCCILSLLPDIPMNIRSTPSLFLRVLSIRSSKRKRRSPKSCP